MSDKPKSYFQTCVDSIVDAETVKLATDAIAKLQAEEGMTPTFRASIFDEALQAESLKEKPRETLLAAIDEAAEIETNRILDEDPVDKVAERKARQGDQPVIAERVAPLDCFAPHPDLARISMMEDAQKFMAKNHHGDPRRKEAAEELAAEWEAFIDEIREEGVLEPVKVIPGEKPDTWLIVDGRHRWQASVEGGLSELPFIEVDEAEARAIMEGTIAARRNYTKGQKAFAAVIFHPELLEAKAGRPEKSRTECGINSREEIATKYGVSERLLDQAIELHQKIKGKKRVAQEVELQVWSGLGLGGILSGLAGKEVTVDKPRRPSDSASVLRTLKSLSSQVSKFDEWPREERIRFADDLEKTFQESPESVKDLFHAVLNDDAGAVEEIVNAATKGGQA